MALEPVLKKTVMAITDALKSFAKAHEWDADDYRILFHLYSDWGNIRVLFVVKDFAGGTKQQMWNQVDDLLKKSLSTLPEPRFQVGLIIRSQEEVAQGGIFRIHEDYLDQQDLILKPVLAD